MANNITVGVNLTPEARAYFAQLQELADKKVCVGFQVGKDDYEDGTPLVEVAFCNEFGTLNEDGSFAEPSFYAAIRREPCGRDNASLRCCGKSCRLRANERPTGVVLDRRYAGRRNAE